MFRGLFVTGTDTDVGKTTVAAALMHRYRALQSLKYWKPFQTGIESSDDTETVERLGGCATRELHPSGVRLPGPVAPYLAAEQVGTRVSTADLIALAVKESDSFRWVVEGAGGILVPINESEYMTDLIAAVNIPVLVVARSSLGTINHTLLTIEALLRRGAELAGVILVGPRNADNRRAVERFGHLVVIDEMPRFTQVTPETLGRWATSEFDTQGRLERYFK